ncbi:HTH-type transcriptional activator RhaS [Roseovarius albus]|uniref:HTH-type transcriptional activator RhaS n=2 Tax=Roseovarius albus TaxID=1247867 RepID=A0A1X7A8C2_9RHOB|nr:HTH-type transcriptional activator RhaS [Roseovarius albus]
MKACLTDANDISKVSEWDLDFRQIEPGDLSVDIAVIQTKKLSLLDFDFSRKLHQTGVSPRDQYTIALPYGDELQDWEGAEISSSSIVSFGMGNHFDCVSRGGFSGITISIKKCDIENAIDDLGLNLSPGELESAGIVNLVRQSKYHRTRQALSAIIRESPLDLQDEDIVENLLSMLQNDTTARDKSNPRQRHRAVSIASEIMVNHEEDNIPMTQVCQEAGVSLRCLQRGFKERFGVGPKTYHKNLRLMRVRSELLEANPSSTVSDIANAYGFWHMGQFAKDYRKLFNELPSDSVG